ncbi:hypothetical protein JMG10_07585 [Nostoc ellipsosporum NOK]|nr:hypothetical protein [Nostoc ellipsosporum NOK]
MANKYCDECTHWERVVPSPSDAKGICKSNDVKLNVAVDGKTMLGEESTIWTSPLFGCIFWENSQNLLMDMSGFVIGDDVK